MLKNIIMVISVMMAFVISYTSDDISFTQTELPDGTIEIRDESTNTVVSIVVPDAVPPPLTPSAIPDQTGWPYVIATSSVTYGSPTVGDIDYDGDLEVVFGSWDDKIYALNHDGTPVPGWPVDVAANGDTVALCDIDGDGMMEIFAGSRYLYGFRHDGTQFGNWPGIPSAGAGYGLNAPTVDDLDGDGDFEIVMMEYGPNVAWEGRARIWDANGNLIEEFPLPYGPGWSTGSSMTSCATGDFDEDGEREIVFVCRSSHFAVCDPDGTVLWWKALGVDMVAEPAVGDIDGDGKLEIVAARTGAEVYMVNGEDGSMCSGWPQETVGHCNGGISLGDIDNNGTLEISIATLDDEVNLWKADGSSISGWPPYIYLTGFNGVPVLKNTSGVLGVLSIAGAERTFSNIGRTHSFDLAGNTLPDFPIVTPNQSIYFSVATLVDLDLDGDTEMLVGSNGDASGSRMFCWDIPEPFNPYEMEWRMDQHNIRHTGEYAPPEKAIPLINSMTPNIIQENTISTVAINGENFGPEAKPFIWIVPEADTVAFYNGNLSLGIPAAMVTPSRTDGLPWTWHGYTDLEVELPALPAGTYEIVVQNPTGIRNQTKLFLTVEPPRGCYPPYDPCIPGYYPSDINCDGCVDGLDVAFIGRAFGEFSGDPLYNEYADLDQDGKVDGEDLMIIAHDYGRGCRD